MDGGDGQRCAAAAAILYWPERRRTGHKENDKEVRRGYANGYGNARKGTWQGFQVLRGSVGLGRARRTHARQVFEDLLAHRARTSAYDRKNPRMRQCHGSIQYTQGSLVA
jgi:hypothetical protein